MVEESKILTSCVGVTFSSTPLVLEIQSRGSNGMRTPSYLVFGVLNHLLRLNDKKFYPTMQRVPVPRPTWRLNTLKLLKHTNQPYISRGREHF